MPELKRNFFYPYYEMPAARWNIFYGCEMYHAVDCGDFTDSDGNQKKLVCIPMCKDELPDTQGRNVEMCDFSLIDSDLDNQPIMAALMTDPQAALALVPPCVQALLMQDFAEGLTPFEIADRRAGVLVPEFLGFALAQVLSWRPDIYQPTQDEDGNEVPNVTRCSLEAE